MKHPVVIYPPTVDWDHLHQRPQQIIKAASRKGAVGVFCNPNMEHRHPNRMEQVTPTMILANRFGLHETVSWVRNAYPGHPVVVIYSYPPQTSMVHRAGADLIIFDTLDEPVGEFAHWFKDYSQAVRKADLVIASAKSLQERAQRERQDEVLLLRNACDFEHFRKAQERKQPVPESIFSTGRKIIGFYGAVASWLDWPLIDKTAQQLHQMDFVFIGPAYGPVNKADRPNIHYLGARDYNDLPRYLSNFDVCTVPFEITEMTKGVSPIKMWEYLASGTPVVSTRIPEAIGTQGVSVPTPENYASEIALASTYWDRAQRDQLAGHILRIQTAKMQSWEVVAERIIGAIYDRCNPNQNRSSEGSHIPKGGITMPEQKPSVGRVVHYVMPFTTEMKPNEDGEYQSVPAHRPAIIVRVWDRTDGLEPLVQLQVFTDGTNDGKDCASGLIWATSVVHDEENKSLGTWHWPERE